MASRTVSLEEGAYLRLKAAKRRGESFSEVVNRILAAERPSYLTLKNFLSKADGVRVRSAIREMRDLEERAEIEQRPRRKR